MPSVQKLQQQLTGLQSVAGLLQEVRRVHTGLQLSLSQAAGNPRYARLRISSGWSLRMALR